MREALDGEVSDDAQIAAARCAQVEIDRAGPRAPALQPVCAAGCSYCCHVHAEVTRPELLALVAHLREAWTPEATSALRERLVRQVARVGGMSDAERWAARIPCALLDDAGGCSIHVARPLRCRAFHSCSVEPCREAFEGRGEAAPVKSPLLARAQDAAEEGYDRALIAAGLTATGERLESGLLALLDRP